MTQNALQAALAEWKESFGGGMIPFDFAYQDCYSGGGSIAQAQIAGGHALLESFVEYVAKREAKLYHSQDPTGSISMSLDVRIDE
jgi:hypothetical protein